MASKNNAPSQPAPVVAPTGAEILGNSASGTLKLANAGATGNVAGATTALGGIAQTLATGGATALDPQLRAQYDKLVGDVSKATKGWTNKIGSATTKITTLTIDRDELQAKVTAGETLSDKEQKKLEQLNEQIAKSQAVIDDLQPKLDAQNARVTSFLEQNIAEAPKLTELISEEFPELAQALSDSEPFLQRMGQLGYDGTVLRDALREGYTASQITYNNAQAVESQAAQLGAAPTATAAQAATVQGPQAVQGSLSETPIRDVASGAVQAGQVGPQQQIQAQQVRAAQMNNIAPVMGPSGYTPQQIQAIQAQRVADIRAQQVGQGALGGQLMAEAQRRVALNGQLSPEATRDAIQSARQGFAARGMATGNAALAAELLNRDRYSRQRGLEDLQFAQSVQGTDIARQQANMDAALRAGAANQGTAAQLSLADQSAVMNAQQLNQAAGARAAEFVQSGQLQAGLANAQTAYNTAQTNAQLAQQAVLANQDADLRAQAANQGTTLSAGTMQAQLSNQAAIASAANQLTAGQSNQAADINRFTQGNQMNQFNAGQANQLGLAGAQLAVNQNQFNAGQANQVGLANLELAGEYGLAQGQLTQGANNLNAQLRTGINQYNAGQNFAASAAQADENFRGYGANMGALQGAYGLDQETIQSGLGAAGIRAGLAGAANPNTTMLNWYGMSQPVGSQAMGPATSAAIAGAEMNLMAQGFNANAAWNQYNSYYNNQAAMRAAGISAAASQQAGTMGMVGGIGGGLLLGVGVAI